QKYALTCRSTACTSCRFRRGRGHCGRSSYSCDLHARPPGAFQPVPTACVRYWTTALCGWTIPPATWKSYAVHPPTTRPHTRRKDPAGAALAPPGQWHNAVLSSIPTAAVYPDGRKCADTAPIPVCMLSAHSNPNWHILRTPSLWEYTLAYCRPGPEDPECLDTDCRKTPRWRSQT